MKEVRTGIQKGRKLEAEANSEAMEEYYWLDFHGLLSLLSYRSQDHKPRDGPTHHGPPHPH